MSIDDRNSGSGSRSIPGPGGIARLIEPRASDLGELSVRRLLPDRRQRMVGPWIFFDHFGPVVFPPHRGIDVRPHPHINLATVTYLFEGEILHRDSLGHRQRITPGAINLMVAGRGIVHSEREPAAVRAAEHRLHGLQLWLALPDADEETAPAFHHYPAQDLPRVDADGVDVRVLMGTAYGATSPVLTHGETLYLEARLKPGQRLRVPDAGECALYPVDAGVRVGDTQVAAHRLAVLDPGDAIVEAVAPSRIVLIGGDALGERHVEWNFVSRRRERIEQAKQDWRAGRFPKVPGDEEEFIPLPD